MSHNERSPQVDRDRMDARHLAERLAAIEASSAWAVARRLSQLRQRLAPEGSWRLTGVRLGVRGLRLWWREGTGVVSRRAAGKLARRLRRVVASLNSTRGVLPKRWWKTRIRRRSQALIAGRIEPAAPACPPNASSASRSSALVPPVNPSPCAIAPIT